MSKVLKPEAQADVVLAQRKALVKIEGTNLDPAEKVMVLGYTEFPPDVPTSVVRIPLSGTWSPAPYQSFRVGVDISDMTLANPQARKKLAGVLLEEAMEIMREMAPKAAKHLFNMDLAVGEE